MCFCLCFAYIELLDVIFGKRKHDNMDTCFNDTKSNVDEDGLKVCICYIHYTPDPGHLKGN
jgi:hypothetical protein